MDGRNLNDARPNSDNQVQPIVTVLEKVPPRRQLDSDTNNDLDVECKRDYKFGQVNDFLVRLTHVGGRGGLYHERDEG